MGWKLPVRRGSRDYCIFALTGGEPFLWPDFWKLYDALIHMGFLVSINTNGSLIDDEAIRKLQELPPTRVNITLYGASDATYERLCRREGRLLPGRWGDQRPERPRGSP